LCCYDGVSFRQVKGVGQHAVLSLREDREGRLWIGTSAGVKCYDGRDFKALTREDGLPCEIVTAIHQDLDGTFWFGTEGGGICRYDGQICQVIQIPGDQRCNVIHAILQDSSGCIWLATEGGLVEYTRTRIKPEVCIEEVVADKRYVCPTELQVPSTVSDIRIRLRAQSSAFPRSELVYRYRLEGHDTGWRQTREHWVEYSQLKAGAYVFAVEAVDPDLNYSPARLVRIELTTDPRIGAINAAVWSSVGQGEFVGTSSTLQKVLSQIQVVAPSDLSVLILGETGTGKGLVARAVHVMSDRREGPFVFVNCGTLQGSLVDSELFGHERGAFTGATSRKIGKFELAEGGSIFLDEIGDLPGETQVRLLHVIQDRFIERVGGTRSIPLDVRIIAATNRDLRKAVERGQFRADLFYRLNDFPIVVPPLRERMEDVPLLAVYFVRQIAGHLDRPVPCLSREAMELLISYDWPGNVRELEHVLRRAVIQVGVGEITPSYLSLDAPVQGNKASTAQPIMPMEEYERQYLRQVLEHTGGVIYGTQGAAALLGLHPNTLRSRMKKLGVKKPKQGFQE
jgi:DNA-binding NtrC family response regulator